MREWWLTPWWRGRGSPSDIRSTAIGVPPRAAAASRMPATSSALVPSGDDVPTTPGPIATIVGVGVGDVTGQGEGRRHRHRLEVATEGVARGDGHVDEPDLR